MIVGVGKDNSRKDHGMKYKIVKIERRIERKTLIYLYLNLLSNIL